jgi:hypothetical protein
VMTLPYSLIPHSLTLLSFRVYPMGLSITSALILSTLPQEPVLKEHFISHARLLFTLPYSFPSMGRPLSTAVNAHSINAWMYPFLMPTSEYHLFY